jgi:short-subunit dehydrogenase
MSNQKFALITGATSGIGFELAKLFAQDKYNLILIARSQDELQQAASILQSQYGIEVIPIAKDLFERESPTEVYDEVKSRGITVNVLVNDAGQGQYGKFTETDLTRELDIIQLNIATYVALTKFFLKDMVARNEGKILNVSSIGGEMPGPLQAVYHATKAFVTSFTEAVNNEIKDTQVTMTVLLPGVTDTNFFDKAEQQEAKGVQDKSSMADPAKVAKDGYEALMSGDDKVISGFKNKAMVTASQVMPDSMVADNMHKMMEPVNKSNKQ